ncbi:MAG: glycosyltransferase family 39 protein [Cocleimonas sp.]|nr:glycosyltransferase family 39 protein [Cocleimonas sp.]
MPRITENNIGALLPSKELITLLLALLALTLWRYNVMSAMSDSLTSLYIDEAQYWFWSQHLDLGFYSKPPVIALIIATTTAVCGEGETCIRAGSLIIYPLTTLLIYFSAAFLFNRRTGLVSALVFITLPAVSLSSLVISTDIALFFFWALAFYGLIRALDSNEWHWWLLMGFAGGMGMESKYTMGIFVFSALAYLLFSKQFALFKNPRLWAAALLAFALWLPNLYWNAQHGYITFVHTSEIAEFEQRLFHWDELGTFIIGQFLVFGPVFFGLFLIISFSQQLKHKALLISFSWMFLGIILLQALFGRANANWAAPAYITASLLVTAWLLENNRLRLIVAAISINLALGALVYHTETLLHLTGYEITSKTDLRKRLKGWRAIGQQYKTIQTHYPTAILLGTDRTILSHLLYHARPAKVMTWSPQQKVRHHYDLHGMLKQPLDKEFLFVTDKPLTEAMRATFNTSRKLKDNLTAPIYPNMIRKYSVYHLQGFTGYAQQ